MSLRPFVAAAFAVVFCVFAGTAAAQVQRPEQPFGTRVELWTRALDAATQEIARPGLADSEIANARDRIVKVRDAALAARRVAEKKLAEVESLLAALGAPPGEGAPPEAADIAAQRGKLEEDRALYEGRIKQADLFVARSENLLRAVASARRKELTARLLARAPSPALPATWIAAGKGAFDAGASLAAEVGAWWRAIAGSGRTGTLLVVLAAAIASLAAGGLLRRWILGHCGHDPALAEPSYARRMLGAAAEAGARGLLPALATLGVYVALLSLNLLIGPVAPLAKGIVSAIVFYSLVSGLPGAIFAADAPAWRLVPFAADNARLLGRRLSSLVAIIAVGILVQTATAPASRIPVSASLVAVATFVFSIAVAAGALAVLERRLWHLEPRAERGAGDAQPTRRRRFWPTLRLLAIAAAVLAPLAALAGYARLADYLITNLAWTGAVIGGAAIARLLLRDITSVALGGDSPRAAALRKVFALSDQDSRILRFWLLAVFDLILAVAAVLVALPGWGLDWEDIGSWIGRILWGVRVGRFTFSLTDAIFAVLVFAGILAATRLLQRLLEERIFPQTRLDIGVRHLFKTAIGYIGLFIAVTSAVTTVGLDLSNLALIAGALSVGIGFGLQNIVNNFVSGLILLIERPIKIGDWVVVGAQEGTVQRISVRATEIRTFQRASVIIPNSELLSTAVTNWTHKDRRGRVDVPVGVAYGSDTDKVREILVQCAREHPKIASIPEPYVIFQNFGNSSLDFELRAYLNEVFDVIRVASDLRFAIDAAFRAEGIEIPFPQSDVHLRDIDRIEAALAGRAAAPAKD